MKIKPDNLPAAEKDSLGRNKLALEIANGLVGYSKRQKDGIALSITGAWGSGKSTLLGFLAEYLNKNHQEEFKIIHFNPWLFYKEEGLKEAFLIEFALSLKDFETGRTQISKHLKDFIGAFKWVKHLNGTAGNIQDGLETLFDSFGKADSINDIKGEIEKILKRSKKKVLIFIDDIDRLMPDQIMELFQTISLVANFSNVIYILAFDREIVIDSIDKYFHKKGQDYIEKIIQIDYELPKLSNDKLVGIFHSYVDEFKKDYKLSFDSYALKSLWEYHGIKDYFKSMRDFKRFFNSLAFRLPSISDEVNTTDFLAIETIRIFDFASYEKFYHFYSLNYRKRELTANLLDDSQFEYFGSTARDILKALLPKSILHGYRKDTNQKRLHDPAYFERYFSLLKNDADVSEKDLSELINRPTLRKRVLMEAFEYNRIENLIKRLTDNEIGKHYPNYDYTLIATLISFFNEQPTLFEEYSDRVSNMIINLICCNSKKEELIKSFFVSFEVEGPPANLVQIYFFHYIRKFVSNNEYFRGDHSYFDRYYKKHYSFIEKRYLPIFRGNLPQILFRSFTEKSPFIKYLYQYNFAQLFADEYKGVLDALLKERGYVLYMASQLMWLDEKELRLVRYQFELKDTIFPDDTFVTFYNVVKDIEDVTLNEKQKAIKKNLLAVDISDFPKIKFPPDRNPVDELGL